MPSAIRLQKESSIFRTSMIVDCAHFVGLLFPISHCCTILVSLIVLYGYVSKLIHSIIFVTCQCGAEVEDAVDLCRLWGDKF